MKRIFVALSAVFAMTTISFSGPNDSNWIELFRAGDTALSDWIPKIQGYAAGQNPHNSFSYAVSADSTHSPRLEVTDTTTYNASTYGMGHLFYKTPFSDYILRAQYHFPSKTSFASSQGTWTIQNNGLMLHCQSPASMSVSQEYPNSVEHQVLGFWSYGIGTGGSTTTSGSTNANVCLPGTVINYNGSWYSDGTGHHCTEAKFHSLLYDSSAIAKNGANSSNATWPGINIWQYSMARVIDSASMTFWVRSRPDTAWDSVMHFTRIHVGTTTSASSPGTSTPLTSGYIALQMEGTSTEFAKVELLNLFGCTTPTDTAYKTYYVKDSIPSKCSGVTTGIEPTTERLAQDVFTMSGDGIVANSDILRVDVYDLKGNRVASLQGNGRSLQLTSLRTGFYTFRVQTRLGTAHGVYARM